MMLDLTNREALTVLCSVIKQEAARARKKCKEKHYLRLALL